MEICNLREGWKVGRTSGAFCHMEGKKYRASSGGCLGRVPVSGLGSAKEQTGK